MKTKVIAEIGINHNGDLKIAKKLIDIAVFAGCDVVKFQKRNPDVCVPEHQKGVMRKTPWGEMTYLEYKEKIEFGKEEYDEIDKYCKEKNIMWSASAWDLESQDFLKKYDLPFNKIASAMLTHIELLKSVASEGKHTFISTGMSSYTDIDQAVEIFRSNNCPFTLFHTVSAYPSKDEDCNINMIKSLSDRYGVPVGYSGHEVGTVPSLLAVAIGACAVERHITLDKKMYGSDQSASIEPEELNFLVSESRKVTNTMGTGQKVFLQHEVPVAQKLRYFEVPEQPRVLNE